MVVPGQFDATDWRTGYPTHGAHHRKRREFRDSHSKSSNASTSRLIAGEEVARGSLDVFDSSLGTFPGRVSLQFQPNAELVVILPRRVLTALKPKRKGELGKLVYEKVIAPIDQLTPWVNSLFVTTNKSGVLRICVDPRHLKRESYQIPFWKKYYQNLLMAKLFTTVDLRSGFRYCILDEESSLLTTFCTPTLAKMAMVVTQ